jgi:CheY-like chemotaxis protein
MDGIELCRELKRLHPGIPVIYCSANVFPHQIQAALKQCGEEYITKPVDLDRALAIIRAHLP